MSNDYDEIADDFGQIEDDLLYLVYRDIPELIKKVVDKGNEKIKVCDFGCGPGLSTGVIDNIFKNLEVDVDLVGVDRNEENIRIASENSIAKYHLIQDNKMPFQDNEFDIVFCIFVFLEQESEEKMSSLISEIKRCMKPGAVLIALNTTVDAYDSNNTWLFLENNYPENSSSINNVDKGHQKVRISLKNTQFPIVFEDYLWSLGHYRKVYGSTGLELTDEVFTLGYENEKLPWKSELEKAPYVIHTLSKNNTVDSNNLA